MMMKLKTIDTYIVLLMTMMAIFSGHQLFFGSYLYSDSNNRVAIASIKNSTNTVKQKNSGFLSWFDAKKGSLLADGDQIYTHKNSQTNVSFLDGSSISVFEESLLKIQSQEKNINLDLKKGILDAVFSKVQPNLTINIGGMQIKAESSDAKIQITKKNNVAKITVLEGSLKLSQKEQTKTINRHQVLKINSLTKKQEIEQLKIIPSRPQNGEVIWFKNKSSFTLELLNPIIDGRLEISNSTNFKSSVLKKEFSGKQLVIQDLTPGRYFWRIKTPKALNPPIFNFTLKKETAPLINFEPEILWTGSDTKILIRWNKLTTAKATLVVKSDKDYHFPIEGEDGSLLLPLGHPINTQLWIEADKNERSTSLDSIKKNLLVKKASPLQAPLIVAPDQGKIFQYYDSEQASIRFAWDSSQNASSYQIEVENQDGKNQIFITSNIFYRIKLEQNPKRFRVKAKARIQEFDSPYSQWRDLNIKKIGNKSFTPGQGVQVLLDRPDQDVQFKWAAINKESVYIFEASSDPDFQNILTKKKSKYSHTKASFHKTGTIYWRTKVISPEGDAIYSRPVKVEISPSPVPEPPTLKPFQKIELKLKKTSFHWSELFIPLAHAEGEGTIQLEWQEDQKAKKYLIEIYSDKALKNKILSQETTEPFLIWEQATPGTFYYRVAIIDHWERQTKFSNVSEISITAPEIKLEKLPIIQLKAPLHRKSISNKNNILFKWKKNKLFKNYTLLISEDLSFSNPKKISGIKRNYIRLKRSDLPQEGRIYWKVVGISQDNRMKDSKRRIVDLVTLKKKVVVKKPEKKQRKKRKPTPKVFREKITYLVTPTKVTFEQTATLYNATIDGTAINAHQIHYTHRLFKKHIFLTSLKIERGQVFTDLSYGHYAFSSEMQNIYRLGNFKVNGGAAVRMLSEYQEVGNKLSDQQSLLAGGVLSISRDWEFNRLSHQAKLKIEAGTYIGFEGNYQLNYLWRKNKYFTGNLNYQSMSLTGTYGDLSMNEFGLGLGMTWLL